MYADLKGFFDNVKTEADVERVTKKMEHDRAIKAEVNNEIPDVLRADLTKDDIKRSNNPSWTRWFGVNLVGKSDDPVINKQREINRHVHPDDIAEDEMTIKHSGMLEDYESRMEELAKQTDELRKEVSNSPMGKYIDPLYVPGFDDEKLSDKDEEGTHSYVGMDGRPSKGPEDIPDEQDGAAPDLPREQGKKDYPTHERLAKLPIISHLPLDRDTTQSVIIFHQHLIKNSYNFHRIGLPPDVVSRRYSDEVSAFWTLARRRLFNYRASYIKTQPDILREMLKKNRPSSELHDVEMQVAEVAIMTIDTLTMEGHVPTARVVAKQAYEEGLLTKDFIEDLFFGSGPALDEMDDANPFNFSGFGGGGTH